MVPRNQRSGPDSFDGSVGLVPYALKRYWGEDPYVNNISRQEEEMKDLENERLRMVTTEWVFSLIQIRLPWSFRPLYPFLFYLPLRPSTPRCLPLFLFPSLSFFLPPYTPLSLPSPLPLLFLSIIVL